MRYIRVYKCHQAAHSTCMVQRATFVSTKAPIGTGQSNSAGNTDAPVVWGRVFIQDGMRKYRKFC